MISLAILSHVDADSAERQAYLKRATAERRVLGGERGRVRLGRAALLGGAVAAQEREGAIQNGGSSVTSQPTTVAPHETSSLRPIGRCSRW